MSATADHVDAYWMPFTANRDFKKEPRIITGAEGHYYTTKDGAKVYDLFAGLWTSGVGHCHPKIVEAVQKQVATLDFAMSFQVGNNRSFELAERVTDLAHELGFRIGRYRIENGSRLPPRTRRRQSYEADWP